MLDAVQDENYPPTAWRQVVDSAAETAIIVTDVDGRVRMWNAGATRILGWSEGEMLGQPLDRLFTPQDQESQRLQSEMSHALARG
ncbi:PAS domain-containing protein, partial [Pelomonas sp. KK5]|uniref:PAS domain-containing protein n=1 Tax=Pelomonas sp. KK5 TaxID=1855730 RepID=UPI00117F0003